MSQLIEKLMRIQTQLKAPKNLYNSFGGYKYRNAEGICEAVKPYLAEAKVSLKLTDEIVEVGGRVYVKATAVLKDCESIAQEVSVAFARESDTKKGMDASQITGTASSYARKYALNGLFLLDDTKDPDTDEYHKQAEAQAKKQKEQEEREQEEAELKKLENSLISKIKINALINRCENEGVDTATIERLYSVKDLAELTEKKYENINRFWNKIKEEDAKCK